VLKKPRSTAGIDGMGRAESWRQRRCRHFHWLSQNILGQVLHVMNTACISNRAAWVKAECQAPQRQHTVKVVCFCKRKTLALTDDFFEPFSFSHCCISTHIIHLKPSSKLDTHHHFYQNARQDVISTHTALTRCLPAATLCASPRCPSTAFSSPRNRCS
jgi:hypothetical protein